MKAFLCYSFLTLEDTEFYLKNQVSHKILTQPEQIPYHSSSKSLKSPVKIFLCSLASLVLPIHNAFLFWISVMLVGIGPLLNELPQTNLRWVPFFLQDSVCSRVDTGFFIYLLAPCAVPFTLVLMDICRTCAWTCVSEQYLEEFRNGASRIPLFQVTHRVLDVAGAWAMMQSKLLIWHSSFIS